jgi:type I restriction enzyme S subunit
VPKGKKRAAVDAGPVEGPWALPDGWRWERLGALVEKSSVKHLPDPASELRFVGLEHIPPHQMTLVGDGAFCEMRSPGSAFEEGDVLYGRLRPYLNKVWKATFAGACSGELLVLRPHEGFEAAYLAYVLHGPDFVAFAAQAVTGDRPRMDFGVMAGFPVPVPPPDAQDAIVARIDELFAEIDDGERALATAESALAAYRDALTYAGMIGELTADWRRLNEPSTTGRKFLDGLLQRRIQSGSAGKSKRPVEVDPRQLPELPPTWSWASLDQLCGLITSGSRAWSPYYDRGTCVFIMAQNVRRGRYDDRFVQLVDPPLDDPERRRTQVRHGDLLLTIVGANTGDLCQVNFDPQDHFVCQSVALLRPIDPLVGGLIELFFTSAYGRALQMDGCIYGAGRPHLSFDQIKGLAVPLPPPDEAAEIIRRVAEQVGHAPTAMLGEVDPSSLRQSILAAAFRGDLVA